MSPLRARRRPSWPRRVTALFLATFSVALTLSACTDSTFCTRGVYEAPASKLRLTVLGRGTIPAGQDTTERYSGQARLCPTGGGGRALDLHFTGRVVRAGRPGSALSPLDWSWRDRIQRLTAQLRGAGHDQPLVSAELDELAQAIEGALSGPKGTLLVGQSKRLRVVRVDHAYSACSVEQARPLKRCAARTGKRPL